MAIKKKNTIVHPDYIDYLKEEGILEHVTRCRQDRLVRVLKKHITEKHFYHYLVRGLCDAGYLREDQVPPKPSGSPPQ